MRFMEFSPLHRCPDYKTQCAEVLNEEWKRSLSARLHSLEKSRDNFPICLVLLETQDGVDKSVVGHSRLSDVFGQTQKSCLIESVKKSHRGKGYGLIVMQRTEQFAASEGNKKTLTEKKKLLLILSAGNVTIKLSASGFSKGYKVMYLTTHDKQDFYKHLGYEFCSPVLTVALDILPDHLAKQLMENLNLTGQVNAQKKLDKESPVTSENDQSPVECLKCDRTVNNGGETSTSSETAKTSQENRSQSCVLQPKTSTPPPVVQAPPPPPPPAIQAPPPPPPPVIKSSNKDNCDSKTAVRWDPSKISWMKKCL